MKNAIRSMFAATVLFSVASVSGMAEGTKKMITLNTVLPVTIMATEMPAPEAVYAAVERDYTPAQKAASVELNFRSQKKTTLKAADFLIESVPVIEGPAPDATPAPVAHIEYTPVQKAALVELTF